MTPSKKAFGQFVMAKRQAAGLTQRELADLLYITESAVSKWERGLSYPDITLVAPLADQLRVSEGELINASDDHATQRVEREARVYRRWKAAILWTTAIAYATGLVTCFIVNLAVEHTLSWYWVVVAAIALAFCLTTLPLLPVRHRGWLMLGGSIVSLFALLAIVRGLYSDDGGWLLISISAVLFAVVLVIGPIWLARQPLPWTASHHRTVIALAADTVALFLLLLVVMASIGRLDLLWTRALPIAGVCAVLAWAIALVIRYLPVSGLYKAAIAVALFGVYSYAVVQPAIVRITGAQWPRQADLGRWDDGHINGNVDVLSLVLALLLGAVFTVAAAARGRRERALS